MLAGFGGGVAAAAMLASCLWAAYGLAGALLPTASQSVRWLGALVVALWLQVAMFYALAPFGGFTLAIALPAWLVLAAAVSLSVGRRSRVWLASDLAEGRATLRLLSASRWRYLLLPGIALTFVHLFALAAMPPLGWDALTYHLLKAGRWVQSGAMLPEAAPDAWSYYEYFSPIGDVPWAWSMLATGTDVGLVAAGALAWSFCMLAAYAAARALGAGTRAAVVAGAVVGWTPAVFTNLAGAASETHGLALFLASVVFLQHSGKDTPERARALVLAAAALGLLVGLKLTGAAAALIGAAIIAGRWWRAGERLAVKAEWAVGVAVAFAIGAPPYLRAWLERGSPFYPFPLRLGELELLPGNEEMIRVGSATDFPAWAQAFAPTPWPVLRAMFLPRWLQLELFFGAYGPRGIWDVLTEHLEVPLLTHFGFGPAAAVLPLLALVAAAMLLRRPGRRLALLFLGLAALANLAVIFDPAWLAVRVLWVEAAPRFLLLAFGAVVVVAAALPEHEGPAPVRAAVVGSVWALALVVVVLLAIPLRWTADDAWALGAAIAAVVGPLSAALAVVLVGRRIANRGRARSAIPLRGPGAPQEATDPRLSFASFWRLPVLVRNTKVQASGAVVGATVLALVTAGAVTAVLGRAREPFRYAYYRATNEGSAWGVYPLSAAGDAWPIWQSLDTAGGLRLAVAAGWDGVGHNWLRYPLLGSRLQNEVLYVPVTGDGAIVDYRLADELVAQGDRHAWLARLSRLEIDVVVLLAPRPPLEADWIASLPALFTPVATGHRGESCAYRFDRAAALALLTDGDL